jgi:serine protease Do
MRLLIAAFTLCFLWVYGAQANTPQGFADVVEPLLPSVVNISTTTTSKGMNLPQGMPLPFPPGSPMEELFNQFFNQAIPFNNVPRKSTSLGSGFIISSDGLVVTNNHVIDGADTITVILSDNTELPAKLIGKDDRMDLALLKVTTNKSLPAVRYGDSDKIRVGDWVVAIGNPLGFGGTVTAGIVSARSRNINLGAYDDFIQTDAAINRGNSGGPMFNGMGEVIGINTVIVSPSGGNIGIGFAIPINQVRPVIDQLFRFGKAKRGWLGVSVQNVSKDIADSLGLPDAAGALVAEITPDSPAAKAGLREGDIITRFGDALVGQRNNLPKLVAGVSAGTTMPITLFREGKEMVVNITVVEMPDNPEGLIKRVGGNNNTRPGSRALGLELSNLTDDFRQQLGLDPAQTGILILNVAGGSEAAEKGLGRGMLITAANQRVVRDLASFEQLLTSLQKSGKTRVLLQVQTPRGEKLFITLSLKEQP